VLVFRGEVGPGSKKGICALFPLLPQTCCLRRTDNWSSAKPSSSSQTRGCCEAGSRE
jgi:hypothetical protein